MSEKDGRAMHPHGPHTDRGPLSTGNCAQWPVPLGSAALSRTGEAVLEDIDMKRTFERIVSSIHLDDDAEDHVAPLSKGMLSPYWTDLDGHLPFLDRGIVPDLNSPASSSTFSFTPRSSPNHGTALPLVENVSVLTLLTRCRIRHDAQPVALSSDGQQGDQL